MNPSLIALSLIQLLILAYFQLAWSPKNQSNDLLNSSVPNIPQKVIDLYDEWLAENRMNLQNTKSDKQSFEYQFRLSVFFENLQTIEHLNSLQLGYEAGSNQFMDLTEEEWLQTYVSPLGLAVLETENQMIQEIHQTQSDEPSTERSQSNVSGVNWVNLGAVRPPENQLRCNSSYAFASKGICEGYQKIHQNTVVTLSAQQIVDCSMSFGNSYCQSGQLHSGLEYISSKGVVTEDNYKYVGVKTDCKIPQKELYKVQHIHNTPKIDCKNIVKSLDYGPVGAVVDVINWRYYKSGVFRNCGTFLTQSVLVVGYDDQENWIVKNSWGTTWGDQGFIKLAPGNTCGICQMPSWQTP